MELPKNHLWMGGGDVAKDGLAFLPNIPTEEIFSAPKADGVNGTVVGTMPNVFRGNLIEDFSITFKDGKVVSFDAKSGKEHLENMINDIPNMDMLGEIALVEHDSPISNMGILFYNTLYDENASCHLALGSAYPDCIEGGGAMTEDQRREAGINVCDSHQDFMFGSADMSIVGITADGEEIAIFKDGNFVI
jgi:aminopeptidase